MTREEAIAILNHNVSACLHGTEWGEALDMAIKALEQEPTYTGQIAQKGYEDGKKDGYVQAKLEQEPILDKIRAEIEALYPEYGDGFGWEEGRRNALNEVMKIIDKYKVESEGT